MQETGGLAFLSPISGRCPECADNHGSEEPHNKESLYYQMQFRVKHGRFPTWEDAIAHCDDEVKKLWREELIKAGRELE